MTAVPDTDGRLGHATQGQATQRWEDRRLGVPPLLSPLFGAGPCDCSPSKLSQGPVPAPMLAGRRSGFDAELRRSQVLAPSPGCQPGRVAPGFPAPLCPGTLGNGHPPWNALGVTLQAGDTPGPGGRTPGPPGPPGWCRHHRLRLPWGSVPRTLVQTLVPQSGSRVDMELGGRRRPSGGRRRGAVAACSARSALRARLARPRSSLGDSPQAPREGCSSSVPAPGTPVCVQGQRVLAGHATRTGGRGQTGREAHRSSQKQPGARGGAVGAGGRRRVRVGFTNGQVGRYGSQTSR